MIVNYVDEVIDLLTLLDIDKQAILDKDNIQFALWLKEKEECIETFLIGKYREYEHECEHPNRTFLDSAIEIKNKISEVS